MTNFFAKGWMVSHLFDIFVDDGIVKELDDEYIKSKDS